MAQLLVDLLKDHLVDPDDWQVLVRALNASLQRPHESSLWDTQAWTQQDPAGRALGCPPCLGSICRCCSPYTYLYRAVRE